MSEWQPIETAPKDGAEVLVYLCQADVDLVRLAYWMPNCDWTRSRPDLWPEGWWSQSSCVGQELLQWEPTHWAPFNKPLDTPPENG
jgi:hypothetical protein